MDSLSINLPGYECQLEDDGVSHSTLKVESAAEDLISSGASININNIHQLPCLSYKETINYRSTCTFQIITEHEGLDSNTGGSALCFAMRSKRMPKPLNGDHFPIATPRIQEVMKLVAKNLNARRTIEGNLNDDSSENENLDQSGFQFNQLRTDLSSVSFVSSWNEDMDCITTFNYCQPIHVDEETKIKLISEAHVFCSKCNITTLILRSKKMKEVAGRFPPHINDVLHLDLGHDRIRVDLGRGEENCTSIVPVYYHKPEDAFQHPNGNTMLQALEWILNKLKTIGASGSSPMNLLEMYCGAGAHTIPISKTGIFDSIVAVELDQRLVDACKDNSRKNSCDLGQKSRNGNIDLCPAPTTVHVFGGDAGEWASKSLSRRHKDKLQTEVSDINIASKLHWQCEEFQVLLVDPPRAGLDKEVCNLAINGSFEHIIYVSCGRKALVGDLKVLLEAFDVVDCTITDLFPRTDSVETLVHLRRKI